VTLGEDWPTEELRDVLHRYHLRIVGRERQEMGRAPWWMRGMRTIEGRIAYDPDASWTETHYIFRRDITCESCAWQFGYSFEVDQISRVHQAGRATNGALRRELSHQLRRRMRCPHCRALQREPRRTLIRGDRRQTVGACSLILLGFLLFAALGLLGGWLGGILGFFLGLLAALAGVLVLWYWGFPYIMNVGPTI
jgi:hypothetical protein